jgi:hypothetical protein
VDAMARLSVLRTLAREYNPQQLQIVVLVPGKDASLALRNALLDLDTPSIRFARFPAAMHDAPAALTNLLIDSNGAVVASWPSTADFNAATIGYAVRRELGVPVYAQMDARP